MRAPRQVHDPGLQQERTVLAWDRTGLAMMLASGLLIRSLGGGSLSAAVLVPISTFLLGLVVLILDRRRYIARWRGLQEGEGMVASGLVVTVAAGTVALGTTALVVTLLA